MSTSGANYYARTVSSVITCSQGFIVLVNQKFCFAGSNHIYMNYQFSNCYSIIKVFIMTFSSHITSFYDNLKGILGHFVCFRVITIKLSYHCSYEKVPSDKDF